MKLHDYQRAAVEFLNERLGQYPGAGLFVDCGLGKTAMVLDWLAKQPGKRTLIVAPLRVANMVWPSELAKWHCPLSMTLLQGTPTKRLERLGEQSNLYIITPDLLTWLIQQSYEPFDTLVVDESTMFKSWDAKRTRALHHMLPQFEWRIIMTGTPAADSYNDLFAQIFVLDDGEALGRQLSEFHNRYCFRGGFEHREWLFRTGCKTIVEEKIKPLVYRLNGEKYLDLPELLTNDVWVDLPPAARRQYVELQRKMVATLDGDGEVKAKSLASLYLLGRCLANGGLYEQADDGRKSHDIHTAKVDTVAEIVDGLQGKPALVFYQFQSDLARLQRKFPRASAIFGGMNAVCSSEILTRWNAGRIHVLLCQCSCVSHGLNMQEGGAADMIWVGLPDSLETYQQCVARLHRHGQTNQVRVHRILARGTVDEIIQQRIEEKDTSQQSLLRRLERHLG